MCERASLPTVEDMTNFRTLSWPLIIGLGAIGLVRPLTRITESQLGIHHHAIVPITVTIGISLIWIAVVGLSRRPAPVLTLVFTGLAYGVLSIILSGVVSPVINGHLDGPLAHPIGIVPDLIVNAVWGLITGLLALALQRVRGVHRENAAHH